MNSPKLLITSLLCLFFSVPGLAQDLNQIYLDADSNQHLIGLCDRTALEEAPFAEWFESGYSFYEVDQNLISRVAGQLEGISFDIFMATWCGDSRREVPRFYKVLDALGVGEEQIRLVNVYRDAPHYKQSPTHEEQGKLLHRVPSFIVYRDGDEIGRIVEFPVTSLEMDLVQILLGVPSDPQYKIVSVLDKRLSQVDSLQDRKALFEIAKAVYKNAANDRALNTYGYVLMSANEIDKAIAVFTINTMLFAKEPNVYDSLAEAYERKEDYERALAYYKVVVSLDPENEHALEKIEELGDD